VDVALYIHVPFCLHRCTYCDFNTYAGLLDLRPAYVAALKQELSLLAARYGALHVTTLYFGGGTPSLLGADYTGDLLDTVRAHFAPADGAEITLEANPGTVDVTLLAALRAAGVNRLSLGVQSAHADELALLGRIHTWEEAVDAVALARRAGFDNLSLDLMFGLPGQTLARWEATLTQVLTLSPQHLSLYALTLEPETPLAALVSSGAAPSPDPDLAADMYEAASTVLHAAGFWQYEISNWAWGLTAPPAIWALPPDGRTESIGPWASRHNLTYWHNRSWLGIGAGAHSWYTGRRWHNQLHPGDYIRALQAGEWPVAEEEVIPPALIQGETMMLGLRLAEGVTDEDFRRRFGVSLAAIYAPTLTQLTENGLLEWDGSRARLSARGRLLGNQVFAAFLPDCLPG